MNADHRDLVRHVVLSRILRRLASLPEPMAPWLDAYQRDLAAYQPPSLAVDDAAVWWTHRLDECEKSLTEPTPLARLDRDDALLLVAAGLIEQDVRFGSLFAQLQAPLTYRRPCVGLLTWLLADPVADLAARCQRLAGRGLLGVENPTDPRAEWVVRLPVPVWETLHTGEVPADSLPDGLTLRRASAFPDLDDVVVGEHLLGTVADLPALLSRPGLSAVVVRGMTGSGRTTLLGAAARTLGRDVLVYDGQPGTEAWALFAALASVGDLAPVVRCSPGPGDTVTLPRPPGVDRPLGVVLGRAGGLAGPAVKQAVTIVLGPCTPADRRVLWRESGLAARPHDLDEIVDRFLLTPGNVRRSAPLAHAAARAAGRTHVTVADVQAATRTLQRQSLETLATHLDSNGGTAAPILTGTAEAELGTLELRCRHRERLVAATAGIHGGLNRGVRALFSGPSGTGKTLAARYLAGRLHLDLYRIDLAAVVNKYIGETERNLEQVLARAEELDVVLLLDEGDALMARRTDVSNANDRYANLETNFLLQRLETFEGIVIVTTNAGNRIDPAFLRRIDITVEFVPPDAEHRWQIWAAHLPLANTVEPALLTEIARRCALTGGQIRNAAVHAALLALDRDDPVGDDDVVAAVAREYRRSGASFPLDPARLRARSAR